MMMFKLRYGKVLIFINLLISLFFNMSEAKSTTSYILSVDTGNQESINSNDFLQNVKTVLTEFQGVVTHEYSLINGLSFEMDPSIFTNNVKDKLINLGKETGVTVNIEKDQDVHAFTGKH